MRSRRYFFRSRSIAGFRRALTASGRRARRSRNWRTNNAAEEEVGFGVTAASPPRLAEGPDLFSGKLGFSSLPCRGNTFIDVLRKFKRRTERVGKLARRARPCRFSQLYYALGSPRSQGPVACNDFCKGIHFRTNAVSRNHKFDQTVSLHFSRIDLTARAKQLECSSGTHDIRKPDRRACAGKSAPFCLRRGE